MDSPTTAASGGRSPRSGSSDRPSPRTGRRTASASSEGRRPRAAVRLIAFDRGLGCRFVAGADEAGRGCLAGPLVAAAVLFDHESFSLADARLLEDLNDSKKVPAERREVLLSAIHATAARVAVAIRPAQVIDRDGLHAVNLDALSSALAAVDRPGAGLLSDGFAVPVGERQAEKLVRGDARSAAIAAASIVAKVVRDRWMERVALDWPGYGFESHVGYATAEHRDAISRLGPTPLHRMSFKSSAYGKAA